MLNEKLVKFCNENFDDPKKILNKLFEYKNILIKELAFCAGHSGIAGGQELDLRYEKKNISLNKVIEMQSTGLEIARNISPVSIAGRRPPPVSEVVGV